jgi:hypothetical protein
MGALAPKQTTSYESGKDAVDKMRTYLEDRHYDVEWCEQKKLYYIITPTRGKEYLRVCRVDDLFTCYLG